MHNQANLVILLLLPRATQQIMGLEVSGRNRFNFDADHTLLAALAPSDIIPSNIIVRDDGACCTFPNTACSLHVYAIIPFPEQVV